MKKLLILSFLWVLCFCGKPTYSSTWAGTASNQLVTGAALRDGATATGLYSITTSIPSGKDTKAMTVGELSTYTDIPTGNAPLSGYTSNRCPTKQDILGVF